MEQKALPTLRELPVIVITLAAVWGMYHWLGCPFRFVTGVDCPGCGMTRAWLCVLHGEPAEAFVYHPLYPLVPPAAIVWLLRRSVPDRLRTVLLSLLVGAFVVVYVYRFAHGTLP